MKNEGHRKRLIHKFLKTGLGSLNDYEVVELLLTLGTPRKDCKPQAKEAIKKFKSLRGVLEASLGELQKIKGIGPVNAFGIKLFQQVSERYLKERLIKKRLALKTPKAVFDYLYQSMQKEKEEVFKVFYLNSSNKLLDEKEIFRGTVDQAVIYPREVIKSALEKNATRLIFAHNHPSGNPKPSEHDIEITKRLKSSCDTVEIEILDHLIIGISQYFSFREHGLIG
jgi:DNA repair protein RadC